MNEYKVRLRKGDIEFEVSSHDLHFVEKELKCWKDFFHINDNGEESFESEHGKNRNLEYTDTERTFIEQSENAGLNCFEAHITLKKHCIMKALRITLLLRAMEKHCEIIKVEPPIEAFDSAKKDSFTVGIISKVTPETIRDIILSISEIEKVEIFNIETDNINPSKTITIKKNISIKDFSALKNPETIEDYVIVTCYYMDKYEYMAQFTQDHIINFLNNISEIPLELDSYINENINKGYLIKHEDNKYSLTFSGEQYVKDGLV